MASDYTGHSNANDSRGVVHAYSHMRANGRASSPAFRGRGYYPTRWTQKKMLGGRLRACAFILRPLLLLSLSAFMATHFLHGQDFLVWTHSSLTAQLFFPYAATIHKVPAFQSRFNTPWFASERVRFPTLEESRFRLLYSAVRTAGSDGLGHAMATINADVSTALQLGLSYSHRIGKHGALTQENVHAVEEFFGWGADELSREIVRGSCAPMVNVSDKTCPVCRYIAHREDDEVSVPRFKRLVQVPKRLSYALYSALPNEQLRTKISTRFTRAHNTSHTIFQMPADLCASMPALSRFTWRARAFFFYKYWDLHGLREVHHTPDAASHGHRLPRLRGAPRRPELRQHELCVAVHVRRGDFFRVGRPMTPSNSFLNALGTVMRAVHRRGGAFARMQVVVLVYSGGVPRATHTRSHDVRGMHPVYVDADGTPQSAAWWEQQLLESGLFSAGVRVELRVARDTLQSLHEMIAADVFVGSASGLSTQIVGSLSRGGVQLLPQETEDWCCHVAYDIESGRVFNEGKLQLFWNVFADANEDSATRALRMHNLVRLLGR